MRRLVLTLAVTLAAASAGACGGGDVAVLAQLEETAAATAEVETIALGALPVRLLPYDRDHLFDSLSAAYPRPEPTIPDTIFALQEEVQERHLEWQQAQSRWSLLRDTLQTLSRRMEGMDQASGQYFALFRDFNDMLDELDTLERRSNQAFRDFSQLQSRLNESARQITIERQAWSDDAFAPVDSIIQARLDERRVTELADTTDAQGLARFRNVKPGRWWVHARYDRQFDELYWNVPIDVERGEDIQLMLTRENAEVRPKL